MTRKQSNAGNNAGNKDKPSSKSRTPRSKASGKGVAKAKSKRSKSAGKTAGGKKSWLQYVKGTVLKLTVILAFAVMGYGIYLDSTIQHKFEGQRWQLPALIYARPLELYPGAQLSADELEQELELLDYRSVSQIQRPGEYRRRGDVFEVYRRPFVFSDSDEPAERLQLRFTGSELTRLTGTRSGRNQSRLEPLLLDRMQTSVREDRILVSLDKVPDLLVEALLLIEDRDFYHHFGVSPVAIGRALVANLQAGRTVQGGSTLTQQLAKNFFLSRERSIWRKLREASMALIIDMRYSKDEILEAYLNEIYMGQNYATAVHGFGLAARFYFGRPLRELSGAQIASLVAMIKGPAYFNPWRHPERLLERRDLVLRLLMEHEQLTTDEYRWLVKQPLGVQPRSEAALAKKPAITTLIHRELQQFAPQLASSNGLRIFTSLDPLAQHAAEQAVLQQLPRLEQRKGVNKLQVAMVVTDPRSGEVKAMVGDRNPGYAGFNRAIDARRPIGSLIKPFIYLTALQNGSDYNLASVLADRPVSMVNQHGKRWQPQNYDRKFRGEVAMIDALAQSLNVPAVNLGMSVGLEKVATTLRAQSVAGDQAIYPSALLGAVNLSPFDVAQLYNGLASGGYHQPLSVIRSLVSSDGEVLADKHASRVLVWPKESVYLVNYGLTQVTKRGTAKALNKRYSGMTLAGKTGTTNDARDSWFSGFDSRDVVTVWVGRDDNAGIQLTGSSGALTVFSEYLAHRKGISVAMPAPKSVQYAWFDPGSGSHVDASCKGARQLPADTRYLAAANGCGELEDQQNWWDKLFSSR